jgi:hypothetical protein
VPILKSTALNFNYVLQIKGVNGVCCGGVKKLVFSVSYKGFAALLLIALFIGVRNLLIALLKRPEQNAIK